MAENRSYKWLQRLLLLAIGAGLFWLAVRNQDWQSLTKLISEGSYYNLLPLLLVSFCSYWIRIIRWRMLVKAAGHHVKWADSLAALSVGYMINYAVPRFGELTRSYIIRRRAGVPFELSLGTVIMERAVDILMLGLAVILALLLQFNTMLNFFMDHMMKPVTELMAYSRFFLLIVCAVLVGVSLIFYYIYKFFVSGRVKLLISSFLQGLLSICKVKPVSPFVLCSIGIWSCYFLMTWLWTYTFTESAGTSLLTAYVVMVIGTLGRSLPIQGGGFGAYHYLVSQAFMIYGLSATVSFALAVLIHGGQAVFTILMGLLAYLWLALTGRSLPDPAEGHI